MAEWSYGRLRIQMNKAFDIGVESLSGSGGAENGGLVSNPTGHSVNSDKFNSSGETNFTGGVVSAEVAAAAKSFGDTANGGGTGRWRRRKRRG